jgi:hypothetical protein
LHHSRIVLHHFQHCLLILHHHPTSTFIIHHSPNFCGGTLSVAMVFMIFILVS